MTRSTAQVALVTGANRGLGLETSRHLLDRGLRVAMTGRDLDAVEHARRGLGDAGRNAVAVPLDVGDSSSVAAARQAVVEKLGAVDVVVNNAAVLLFEGSDVLSIPAEGFRDTFDVNVFGMIEVCRAFVPAMAKRGYGRIVNVSSGAGQLAGMSTYAPAYSMSKAAVNAFTRILAATYHSRGVLANSVDPGWVRTDMGGPSAPRSVEEGADTIVWLATLPDDGPTGGFFHDRRPIAW
ncbi:MAG TPA: SDR family NAD(P)-dependent oxidoreductase [Vicinamibacterales bacterium]|jgi:NAD(P)-dependent dehydrogenase (short-subunit alcohol dehydrogenase family)|nr:SDR family NAD(P)-dependent oxidoreductase [Vicinamibacterales bacterium]